MTDYFRRFLMIGSLLAMFAVIIGAMGAHALKHSLSAYELSIFKTAANYQMYHGMALILLSIASSHCLNPKLLKISAILFLFGICIFSGSLYIISLFGIKVLGMITPIGGVSFITAWFLFALAFYKTRVRGK